MLSRLVLVAVALAGLGARADVVADRFHQNLEEIVATQRPNPARLDERIKRADLDSGPIQRLGLHTLVGRWDKRPEYAFACLALGRRIEESNAEIRAWIAEYPIPKDNPTRYGDTDPRVLLWTLLYAESRQHLAPATQAAILEAAWSWVFKHSVANPARPPWNNAMHSVWQISGTENHDVRQKTANLLALEALMRFPGAHEPDSRLDDGLTVREHHRAWLAYWKTFFRERVRNGIDCEIAHPGSYGRTTVGGYYDLHALIDDPELRQLAADFITLFWADVAGEFDANNGIRAGIAATRCYGAGAYQGGVTYWFRNLAWAYGWTDATRRPVLDEAPFYVSTYRPPAIIGRIARHPPVEPYFSTSRRFGLGAEREDSVQLMLFEGAARAAHIRRDVYVAGPYALSGITFDPGKTYSGLSRQSRLAGVTFTTGPNDRIAVLGAAANGGEEQVVTFGAINTAVARDCLVVGPDPSATDTAGLRVFVSAGSIWSSHQEEAGWDFFSSGEGFVAVKIVSGEVNKKTPRAGVIFDARDPLTPIIIQTGRASRYRDPGAFRSAVRTRTKTELADGVLTFHSLDGDTITFWCRSGRVPAINGRPIELNPPDTCRSPFLRLPHDKLKAEISFPGEPPLVLDFAPKS